MNSTNKPYTFDRVVRIIITLLVITGLCLLINRLGGVLLPFFVAWLVAYLVYPLVSYIQYKLNVKSRIISIILAFLLVLILLGGLIYFLQAPVVDEIQKLYHFGNDFLNRPENLDFLPESWLPRVNEAIARIDFKQFLNTETFEQIFSRLVPGAWSIISTSFSFIWNLAMIAFVLLYLVFILLDYEKLSNDWIHFIPSSYRRFVGGLAEDLKMGMNAYFRSQALIALIVGLLCAIGFKIINLPMAITFGLFVGVLNLVPYLQTLSLPLALVLALVKSAEYDQNLWMVILGIAIVYVVVQCFQDMFLTPRIMGKATGLKPAIILLSLSIFGSLMGLVGMIIALPITTLIISYYKRFVILHEPLVDEEPLADDKKPSIATSEANDKTLSVDTPLKENAPKD